jgi:hypothetical protein
MSVTTVIPDDQGWVDVDHIDVDSIEVQSGPHGALMFIHGDNSNEAPYSLEREQLIALNAALTAAVSGLVV